MTEEDHGFAEPVDTGVLSGTRFAVVGSAGAGALGQTLCDRLTGLGATVEIRGHGDTAFDVDGIVHLGALGVQGGEESRLLPHGFGEIKQALAGSPRWFIAAAPLQDRLAGAGMRGLWRTIAREYPQTTARLVEVDRDAAADHLAAQLIEEIVSPDREPVVLRRAGARRRLTPVPAPLGALAATGAGPAGDGAAELQALGLDRDAVVVIIGGARGITAHLAEALAAAGRCRLELLGRTAPPDGAEPAATAAAADAVALRAALVAGGLRAPAEIEREAGRILAGREVSATLARIGSLGSPVRYHCLDVLNGEALPQLLKRVHTEHGRIDAVFYAAGVIEDKLIAEKDPQSFARVFATKADGARLLLAGLDDLPERPRYTVLFGSIAAVFGNRGQGDYAGANDALEALGGHWSARTGAHCLTVHWGPWAPSAEHGGMVSPELAQAYGKRGIALIDPQEGALALLRELAWGDGAASVVYTASPW